MDTNNNKHQFGVVFIFVASSYYFCQVRKTPNKLDVGFDHKDNKCILFCPVLFKRYVRFHILISSDWVFFFFLSTWFYTLGQRLKPNSESQDTLYMFNRPDLLPVFHLVTCETRLP